MNMQADLRTIDSLDELDRLFEDSHERPVFIFKHSSRCGISSHVLEMVSGIESEINLVVVQQARDISDAIAARTGFRHHSPQAFVIRGGKPAYHATHYAIDPERIAEEMMK